MSEQIIGRLLSEWLNSNQHRAYPLKDSTVGNGLPFGFLVDAFFITSTSINSARLYISTVTRSNTNILIKMGGYVDNEVTDFGVVATVPFSATPGTSIPIAISGNNFTLAGSFIIGDTKCMETVPAVIELGEELGVLFPGCVRTTHDTLIGIKVNGTLYSGVVTLEAGEGIEFTTKENEAGETVITITSAGDYTIPEEALDKMIVDDTALLKKAIEEYGEPVRTICMVPPDADGNIVFSTPKTGDADSGQYVEASSTGIGTVCLTITNDKTVVNCTDHSVQIEALVQSLSNLNERSVDIHEAVMAIDTAVSGLALQVSRS